MITMLLDHLWQSTAFLACAAALTLMLRHNGAHTRYWLWFAASMKFLISAGPMVALGAALIPPLAHSPVAPQIATLSTQLAQPFSGTAPLISMPSAHGPTLTTVLLFTWALGAVVYLLIWAIRWLRIDSMRRLAKPLDVEAPIAVKEAPSSLEPGLFGILRPVLLMPQGLTNRLTQPEFSAIVAHGMCHLKRHDNLTAALHMLVQALFWFYPPVWWLGTRLIDERERACDEAVVANGTNAETYAEGVLKVCRMFLHSPLACTSGVSGADLKRRMEAIMSGRVIVRLRSAKKAALAAFATASIAVPLGVGYLTAHAAVAEPAAAVPSEGELARNFAEQARPRTAVPLDPQAFDKFVGYYQLGSYEFLHVLREHDRFMAQFTGQRPVDVFAESPVKFFTKGYPWQISFGPDAQGRVTRLVLHHSGWVRPVPKVADAAALKVLVDINKRIRTKTPSPGTEAIIRRQIAALEKGKPDYERMVPALAAVAQRQETGTLEMFRAQGAFQSLSFKGVAANGADVYEAMFEHGQLEWRIMPLTPDGKAEGEAVRQSP